MRFLPFSIQSMLILIKRSKSYFYLTYLKNYAFLHELLHQMDH